jgi:hypothetical protein
MAASEGPGLMDKQLDLQNDNDVSSLMSITSNFRQEGINCVWDKVIKYFKEEMKDDVFEDDQDNIMKSLNSSHSIADFYAQMLNESV